MSISQDVAFEVQKPVLEKWGFEALAREDAFRPGILTDRFALERIRNWSGVVLQCLICCAVWNCDHEAVSTGDARAMSMVFEK